jgi:hypothetical protein
MTYNQLMNAVDDALTPRVAAANGQLILAESLEQARLLLESGPKRWRLILHWEGYGEHEKAREGMTRHQVATVIQAPRGLVKSPSPTKPGPGGQVPFSEYISLVVAWMSALRFPDGTGADDAGFSSAGSQWLQTLPAYSAHVLSWSLDAAVPPYEMTIPLVFPHLA